MLASQGHAGPQFSRTYFDFPLRPNKPYDETNVTVSSCQESLAQMLSLSAIAEKIKIELAGPHAPM
jgi:hypothetical protein